MTKMGFFYNQAACIGCKTCQIACKDKNALDLGMLFRRVTHYQVGRYPTARTYSFAATCNHCEEPACVEICPNEAMYASESDGTVQHDSRRCIGCQYCVNACPYGVPQYSAEEGLVCKCDACIQLRANGEQPACVAACPMRALEFGPVDELRAAHPDAVSDIAILPSSEMTHPCTLIAPRAVALDEGFEQVWL